MILLLGSALVEGGAGTGWTVNWGRLSINLTQCGKLSFDIRSTQYLLHTSYNDPIEKQFAWIIHPSETEFLTRFSLFGFYQENKCETLN